jgi:hypothetical protein
MVRDQIRDKLPYHSRIWANRASRTSRGRCEPMRCDPKLSPICRHRARLSPRRSRSLPELRASRSWCCPLPI